MTAKLTPCILFRHGSHTDDKEAAAAARHFPVYPTRGAVPPGSLCIPRYAALPFNEELEADLALAGSKLINSSAQHRFVADIMQWVPLLGELTPRTWTEWYNLPADKSFVVKGKTNSRKHSWASRMFCPTRADVPGVAASLLDDALLSEQGIVVREYVPLRTFAIGINGLPITNEWRFFCLNGQIVDAGYYWASEPDYEWRGVDDADDTADHLEGQAPPPAAATALVKEVLARLDGRVPFVVVDVGEKAEGGWICIELNDACQSGVSMAPPDRFYRNLALHVAGL